MAEFMNDPDPFLQVGTRIGPDTTTEGMDGFAAFGKPVPIYRRSAALHHARDMGCTDTEKMTFAIDRMCQFIERDEPYEAMQAGMHLVDLTGTYRLLAVLLCAEKPRVRVKAESL